MSSMVYVQQCRLRVIGAVCTQWGEGWTLQMPQYSHHGKAQSTDDKLCDQKYEGIRFFRTLGSHNSELILPAAKC